MENRLGEAADRTACRWRRLPTRRAGSSARCSPSCPDDLVATYVFILELSHNSQQIKTKLRYVQGLLQVAQARDVSNIPALRDLLEDLTKKADEAKDALDELHYFKIQDQLDGTDGADAAGVTEDAVAFAWDAAIRPELYLDLPLFPNEDDDSDSDDFESSPSLGWPRFISRL